MSVTQATTDPTEMFRIWLCNECYGRGFAIGFQHGVTSKTDVTATKSTSIDIRMAGKTIPFIRRSHTKTSHWFYEFFDPHGILYGAIVDNRFVSYWGGMSKECWGKVTPGTWSGSYSTQTSFQNGIIYYADLREDILVYLKETGSGSGSASGDKVMGMGLGYASFDGNEPGCKGVNTLDAIKMPLSLTASGTTQELITLGGYVPYNHTNTASSQMNVAASDRSGYSGGVAYDTYVWGTYSRIDQGKPYDCKEGSYEEDALPDRLEDYSNFWESYGVHTGGMDGYDASIFDQNYNGQGINNLKNGTYDYPTFINIDVMPHGSFVTDHEGNHFFSMVTADMKTFNKLNDEDPNTISGLQGAGIVYYPIAPV